MKKTICSTVLVFLVSTFSALAAPVSFEGSVAIKKATQPCIDDGYNPGSYFTVVYSYANGTPNYSDDLAIFAPRSAFRIISSDASASLNGAVGTRDVYLSSRAGFFDYTSSSNLSISTLGGAPLSAGVNVKILGTINDAFVSGCTITVHGLLIVRPST